jgi:fatty acid CoA ligase FadD9
MSSARDRDREHEEGRESLFARALERGRRQAEGDEELQRHAPLSESRERLLLESRSSIECLARSCELYAERSCFAERAFSAATAQAGAAIGIELQYTTYARLWSRVQAVASGLKSERLADTGTFVGICGFGSVDWVVADLACLYLAAVSVPIQTTVTRDDLRSLLREAELRCVICSLDQVELIASALTSSPSVTSLIVMDVDDRDRRAVESWELTREALEEQFGARLTVTRLSHVELIGHRGGLLPYVEPTQRHLREPDPLMTLMYTSGSTGSPKGAMFPESLWLAFWRSPSFGRFPAIPHVFVNYMPLNHLAGRAAILRSIREGGLTTFVSRSDMSTLFEDIQRARPTSLMLIPRVSSMIYQRFQSEVVKRALARGVDRRDEAARSGIEEEIIAEMRGSLLGDRLVYALAGTAPTAPEVRAFIERCFEIPLFDSYGSTEAGPITFDGQIMREVVSEIKLTSVPELGYHITDVPHARGELCVKSPRVIPGYYRNPEATRGLFDAEGFLLTGDIVERRGLDEIAWIDRKKNVLKLAQGEFVSTSRLEDLYAAGSPFIRQIYVHGDSLRAYLLAVIVPEQEAVEVALRARGDSLDEASVKALIREELARVAREVPLHGFEIPRDFLIEPSPFTRQKGLLTESEKRMRPRLRALYGERLEQLYEAIERLQIEELYDVGWPSGERASTADRVRRAMEVTLGLRDIDLRGTTRSFLDLGGDSLSALRLADLIRDLCGVEVPVGMLLDPSLRLGGVVRYVEERLADSRAPRSITFEEIHGVGATIVRADDLRIERFFGVEDFAAAQAALPAKRPDDARVTLLTGATGFLGRFLALALLDRASRTGGRVICLVRAPSDAVAQDRLSASYRGPDPALWARFKALSEGRLTVLQGDLMKPRLGLTEEAYDQLCGEVDSIVHNGALVNHAFSYPQLFEPNVLGTVELMRVAARRRIKAMSYVSTVGVAGGLARRAPVREAEDALALWRERPVDSGYAVGYATSKWASEVLLRRLSDQLSVPVTVFRCSMILPHSAYLGQLNVGDFLTRLLFSVVVTGVAPRSFYAGDASREHFDGLPVDFVAGSIAAIGSSWLPGFTTYHVVNARWDDGVSLDRLVDWATSAGYPVTRIADHAAFYAAFRERLMALPPEAQRHSALTILHQWARPMPVGATALFEADGLRERLEELSGEPVELPRLEERTIHAYLRDLVALGLIGEPASAARLKGAA